MIREAESPFNMIFLSVLRVGIAGPQRFCVSFYGPEQLLSDQSAEGADEEPVEPEPSPAGGINATHSRFRFEKNRAIVAVGESEVPYGFGTALFLERTKSLDIQGMQFAGWRPKLPGDAEEYLPGWLFAEQNESHALKIIDGEAGVLTAKPHTATE
jgi:hypothetical protein